MKQLAFGPLCLSIDQFWSMTPAEVFILAEGYKNRLDNNMELLAWHACNIMNVHLKKKMTIKKLLGKEKKMTPFDREKELSKLNKALLDLKERHKYGSNNC